MVDVWLTISTSESWCPAAGIPGHPRSDVIRTSLPSCHLIRARARTHTAAVTEWMDVLDDIESILQQQAVLPGRKTEKEAACFTDYESSSRSVLRRWRSSSPNPASSSSASFGRMRLWCAPHWMEKVRMCGWLWNSHQFEREGEMRGSTCIRCVKRVRWEEIPFSAFPNLCHLEDGSKKAVEYLGKKNNNDNDTQPYFLDK